MNTNDSTYFDSYLPIYDDVPKDWEEARQFLVENLKKISDVVNRREIGWLLDEEVLTGKAFIPAATSPGNSAAPFRQVFRKVVDVSPLSAGANVKGPHGITFDNRFTLIDLWVAGTNSVTLTARNISGNDVIMGATNFNITSPQAFDRAFAFVEYIQEI